VRIGERVRTSNLGEGVIRVVKGDQALVELDSPAGFQVMCPLSEFTALSEPDGAVRESSLENESAAAKTVGDVKAIEAVDESINLTARRSIEALRFGLIPRYALSRLTVGHARLSTWIEKQLPEPDEPVPTLSEVCGPFGTGKSHTMAVVRETALKQNFLTAQVEVDGSRVSLSDPARLLFALWPTLEGENWKSSTPLTDLYRKVLAKRLEPGDVFGYRGRGTDLDPVKKNFRVLVELQRVGKVDVFAERLEGWLSSSDSLTTTQLRADLHSEAGFDQTSPRVTPMINRFVAERPKDFIKVLIGHSMMARLAGYSGLVVTIDEFEIERQDRIRWERTKAVLDMLAKYLAGKTGFVNAPLAIFIASVGQGGHAGDDAIQRLIEKTEGAQYELKPIRRSQRQGLARQLHELYCEAYDLEEEFPLEIYESVETAIKGTEENESGLIRAFIKAMVGNFDVIYGPPGRKSAA
jgi:hypothetical protein